MEHTVLKGVDGNVTGGSVAGELIEKTHETTEAANETPFKDKFCHSTGAGILANTSEGTECGADTPDRATLIWNGCNGTPPIKNGTTNTCNKKREDDHLFTEVEGVLHADITHSCVHPCYSPYV